MQAESREDLQNVLARASGGVVFSTIQKFAPEKGAAYPLLTDRRNVVVISDEAHRSQYGFKARIEKTGEIAHGFAKASDTTGHSGAERDLAIRQIVNGAVASTEIVDILSAARLSSPDVSILSDEFLAEVGQMEKKNLALEAVRKLLNDEIRSRSRSNVVETRKFSERLEEAIARYHINAVSTVEVLQELISLANDVRAARARGEEAGLTPEEVAFYDALADNQSAVDVLGTDQLKLIAHELLQSLKANASVDWAHRESTRARLRVLVKRILRKYGYPITDTTAFRTDDFTTILGAELHAPSLLNGEIWHILGVGLPADFAPLKDGETGPELARRAQEAGAFIAIAHPQWYGLTLEDGRCGRMSALLFNLDQRPYPVSSPRSPGLPTERYRSRGGSSWWLLGELHRSSEMKITRASRKSVGNSEAFPFQMQQLHQTCLSLCDANFCEMARWQLRLRCRFK